MTRLLTFPAGRRAKWVVFATWILFIFGVSAAQLPTKFQEAEKNDSASFLPGDAESTKALEETKRLQSGEQAPIVVVFRREGGLTEADRSEITTRVQRFNDERADLAAGGRGPVQAHHRPGARARGAGRRPVSGHDQRRHRRVRDDPGPDRQGARVRQRPGRRSRGQGDRRGGLLSRRDQGLRGHQRDAAAGRGAARLRAADPDLPQPVLLLDPAAVRRLRRDRQPRRRLFPDGGGRDGQRAVVVDPVGARPRRGDRLRAAARVALPRGAAHARGQARGAGAGAAHRRARRSSPRR